MRSAASIVVAFLAASCASTHVAPTPPAPTTTAPPAAGGCAAKLVGDVAHRAADAGDAAAVALAPLVYETDDERLAFVDGATGASLSFADVVARGKAATAVLVGEQHDDVHHHRLQRRVVEALAGKQSAVGFEMVTWPNQPVLDRFARREIDAAGLAAALDWPKSWGHDFAWYEPIFTAAVDRGARVIALNAPRPLVHAVAKKGVAGLDDAECAAIPALDLGDEVHRAAIRAVFAHHGPSASGDAFERFYAAQVLWDESMADRASQALLAGAQNVVVIAGVGHVESGRGIAQRIVRRVPGARVLTIVPVSADEGQQIEDALRDAVARKLGDVLVVRGADEVNL